MVAIDPFHIFAAIWLGVALVACGIGFFNLAKLWKETEKVQDPADLFP